MPKRTRGDFLSPEGQSLVGTFSEMVLLRYHDNKPRITLPICFGWGEERMLGKINYFMPSWEGSVLLTLFFVSGGDFYWFGGQLSSRGRNTAYQVVQGRTSRLTIHLALGFYSR